MNKRLKLFEENVESFKEKQRVEKHKLNNHLEEQMKKTLKEFREEQRNFLWGISKVRK